MNPTLKNVLIGIGVVVVLGGIVFASLRTNRGSKGPKVYAEAAERRDIAQVVKARGEIQPREKVEISAHVVAKIERLHAREGEEIAAGAPFVELERDAFVAAHDSARAQLAMARTRVERAQVGLADARVRRARQEKLAAEGIVPEERLEASELELRSAELELESARQAVDQARAAFDQAATDLGKTTIVSPLAGRVVSLNAEEGEVVVSGMMNNPASVIGVIADMSEILGEFDVDETEIVDVQLGQEAKVDVDAVRDHPYEGRVVEIGSSGYTRPSQPDVNFFRVKVLLAKPDERLRPGMSARAEIEVERHADALVVPIQAVVERPPVRAEAAAGKSTTAAPQVARTGETAEEVNVVFVLADGKAQQRAVELGISDTTHVEILSGLDPGEQVISGPYRVLKDLDHGDPARLDEKRRGGGAGEDEDDDEE